MDGSETKLIMTIIVRWITITGNQTKEQRRVLPILKNLWVHLLKEFHIRRTIPLFLVDEKSWTLKTGLNMNSRSVAHYNTSIRFKSGYSSEAVLLRESVMYWKDADIAIPKLLRHELVHAKVKKQERGNEHSHKVFGKEAKKHKGVAKKGDY